MASKEIQNIIIKYLSNQASLNELDKLSDWLEDLKNLKLFDDFVKTNYAINNNMKTYDADKTKAYLLDVINKETKVYRLNRFKTIIFKYAAVIVVFLMLGYVYTQGVFSSEQKLEISQEHVELQLGNGNFEVIFDGNKEKEILNNKDEVVGIQKGNTILYKHGVITDKIVYNTLKVPYGKRFKIELSDGTKVDLNAGSSLKYPVNFIKGKKRHVFLKGEGFFNVTKDKQHPFIVTANEIDVEVLGTKFNVSSYQEDESINTVLVEGAVNVIDNRELNDTRVVASLVPGFKATWGKLSKRIDVEKTDVEPHIAWLDGRLILHEVAFDVILKKLERQYNVTFINSNQNLAARYFTAKFDSENIYEVLESLSLSGNFKYKIEKNKIIINP
jgi:hypothetical protein